MRAHWNVWIVSADSFSEEELFCAFGQKNAGAMNARKDGNAGYRFEWWRFPAEILWERRGSFFSVKSRGGRIKSWTLYNKINSACQEKSLRSSECIKITHAGRGTARGLAAELFSFG